MLRDGELLRLGVARPPRFEFPWRRRFGGDGGAIWDFVSLAPSRRRQIGICRRWAKEDLVGGRTRNAGGGFAPCSLGFDLLLVLAGVCDTGGAMLG